MYNAQDRSETIVVNGPWRACIIILYTAVVIVVVPESPRPIDGRLNPSRRYNIKTHARTTVSHRADALKQYISACDNIIYNTIWQYEIDFFSSFFYPADPNNTVVQ